MRVNIVKSKNAEQVYIIKSFRHNGKSTSRIFKKLGTMESLLPKHGNNRDNVIAWAKEQARILTEAEKNGSLTLSVEFQESMQIPSNVQRSFNGGYLFLQQLYHDLGLDRICSTISERHGFRYSLDSILSRLIYGRILFPSSKLNTFEESEKLLEQPDFELQHVYRALDVIAEENDFIQSQLYKNSLVMSKRNEHILYYDCTNFFFEIEEADIDGLRQYGKSKENRPNPIVEMGLMMDGDGIPLAFCVHDGNTSEQLTLRPLEEQIIKDFENSKFVVCTDAGLSSLDNRKFNNNAERAFITTQSLKKLKAHIKEWTLNPKGWYFAGDDVDSKSSSKRKTYDISQIELDKENLEKYRKSSFYKERWIKEDGLEQRLIVTYSLKYRDYQRKIRASQIERAEKLVARGSSAVNRKNANDIRRMITKTSLTNDGEIAAKDIYAIDEAVIAEEEKYDGFYAVCTNLEDAPPEIMKVNHRRWEIEESFRLMKSEFRSRPVYLSRSSRIKAHFTTCFLALTIFRYLEKRIHENSDLQFTASEIIRTLRDMNFLQIAGEGYIPLYKRTELTDALHDVFGFRTDTEIVTNKKMKKILKDTKK